MAFYLNGRPASEPVDPEIVLDLLARATAISDAGDDSRAEETINSFQMHFRPQRAGCGSDAQTEAIAEALLEKYGQG